MDFSVPAELTAYLAELDQFIEDKIMPLQRKDDNDRFFDHRREWARTDFDKDGLPRPEWEQLLVEARKLADEAGHLRFAWPKFHGRQGWVSPVDGSDPRAPCNQGTGSVQ